MIDKAVDFSLAGGKRFDAAKQVARGRVLAKLDKAGRPLVEAVGVGGNTAKAFFVALGRRAWQRVAQGRNDGFRGGGAAAHRKRDKTQPENKGSLPRHEAAPAGTFFGIPCIARALRCK